MNSPLTADQIALQNAAREVADTHLKPRAAEVDRSEKYPWIRSRNCAIQARVEEAFKHEALTARALPQKPIEPEHYRPPPLTRQGIRTRPEWLFHFLQDPGSVETAGKIRPFHVVRMPTFGLTDNEAQALVDYFNALEEDLAPYPRNPEPDPTLVAAGRDLFGPNECFKCHSVGTWRSEQLIGPNLQLLRARNRIAWFHQFIPDPATFIPGTKMTSFWDEVPFFGLDKKRKDEIRALTAYVRKLADKGFREREGFVDGRKPAFLDK